MKLIFITICGAALILLLAYGANAEFNVVQGKSISGRQQEVLAGLALAAVLLGYGVWNWLEWRTENPWYQWWWKD